MAADKSPTDSSFLFDGGKLGGFMRRLDWSASPLGSPANWPESLRTTVRVMLRAGAQMVLFWGPEFVALYNDAYAPTIGNKHPRALGRPARENWSELWEDLEPLVAKVRDTGETVVAKDRPFYIERHGYPETVYFDISYSPVPEADGSVAGVLCIVSETTQRVLAEGRQAFRLRLEERFRALSEPRAVMNAAVEELGRHLGASRVGYSEVRANGTTIDCRSCFADGVAPILGTFSLDAFGRESVDRQRRGETEIVADVQADPAQVHDTWAALDTRAFVSVPLIRDGQFRASLYLNRRMPHAWTMHEVTLIEEVAARTWAEVERARAEEALRERDVALRAERDRNTETLESISDAFYAVDADWRFTYVNRKAEEWWGRSRDELLGKHHWQEFPQAVGSEAYQAHLRAARTREVVRVEAVSPVLHHWVDINIYPRPDGGLSVYFRDIEDKKRAEQLRLESEARLRRVLDIETAGVVFFDFVGGITGANDAFLAMIGYTRKELEAGEVRYERLTPPHWHWRDEQTIAELKASGKAGPFEKEYTRKDGSHIWILCADKMLDAQTAVEFVIDVTDRKRAEAGLRESEARLRALTDNLPSGIVYQIATGADGRERRFLYVSQSHERLTGIPAAAVLADPSIPYKLILPEDRDRFAAAEAEAIRSRRPFDVIARFRRADGEVRWCRIISEPREQPDGSLVWDGIQIDVTEQKAAELGLRELNETLETRVAERTAELLQAQEALRQSQKLEAMGQLTGGVAHDFNNLLTPIVAGLDLLQRRGLGGGREQRLIAGAMQSADRAKTLVQRLLAFARRQPLQATAVDLAKLVAGMADLIASTLGPQIKVVVESHPGLPAAKADSNQLEMALLNLSVNARDAMPDGGTLRITTGEEQVGPRHATKLPPGRYLRLSVADTGVGMDEATLARAVEPFFSTKGIGKGTGLGLSMVHGLASQLGGALTIQSRRGIGTNVELWLPVSEAAAETPDESAHTAPHVASAAVALLVEDEDLVRMSTADMLGDLGYAVVEAGSGEEALRLIREGLLPDLLITDHLMPGISGTDLARMLRSERPNLPVLLVSGYAEDEGVAPDLPRLTKPFRRDELMASLAHLTMAT